MYAKLDRRQGQFHSVELKLVSKQGKTLKNWCKPEEMNTYLRENGFRNGPGGTLETDKELQKKGTFADAQHLATDGDLPIGNLDMKTGGGVNNYAMPSIPVQGAAERLLATKEWPFPEKDE
jgi:hypothetical protein